MWRRRRADARRSTASHTLKLPFARFPGVQSSSVNTEISIVDEISYCLKIPPKAQNVKGRVQSTYKVNSVRLEVYGAAQKKTHKKTSGCRRWAETGATTSALMIPHQNMSRIKFTRDTTQRDRPAAASDTELRDPEAKCLSQRFCRARQSSQRLVDSVTDSAVTRCCCPDTLGDEAEADRPLPYLHTVNPSSVTTGPPR
ncbi:hypothetical protein F2P81_016680 [Scophthalmus maximus]|uniref:Uncharacterized protein n=1 Tax=Scophthalmus maximus TaxID=52904 RepID=A0A6A4SHP6_SCOMX|nr:hypothetical protein F2P81_016680 [Scophthalmus maximus]